MNKKQTPYRQHHTDDCHFTAVKDKVQLLGQQFPTIYKPKYNYEASYYHYQGILTLKTQAEQELKFRVFKDKDLGIKKNAQEYIHDSKNDDDRKTTSTQLERSKQHTINDLKIGIKINNPNFPYTQNYDYESTACSSMSYSQVE